MRSVVFRYESVSALAAALSEPRPAPQAPTTARSRRSERSEGGRGRASESVAPPSSLRGGEGSLRVPEGEVISEGEMVLVTFEIGSRRRATAAAARCVKVADDHHLEFERRDWERLLSFVAARSEHMRASKPNPSTMLIPVAAPVDLAHESPSDAPPRSRRFEDLPPSSVLESTRVPFGAKILVIDDSAPGETQAAELRAMLTEAGLIVELVATTVGAEERMREQTFDALVLDLHAPGIDARELVAKLRATPSAAAAEIPVLFLSSRPTSRDAVDAFASGADDFLPKPFRPTELAARIFGLLRRAQLFRAASANR